MGNADHIINGIFGGARPAARVLGKKPSTVRRWLDGGWIPAWHQAHVLRCGLAAGIDISKDDFFHGGEHVA